MFFIQRILPVLAMGILFLFAPTGSVIAAEITGAPIVTYIVMGGDQQIFSSLGELTQDINQNQAARFADCVSKAPPYGCTQFVITSPIPSPHAVKINGEYSWYDLPRTGNYQSQNAPAGPVFSGSSGPAGGLGAAVSFSCPPGFSSRVTGPNNDRTMNCVLVEPQSCAADGNPINIGTGYKFEYEVDFSTADGFLKLERRYINQFSGWVIEEPNNIVEVLAGASAPMPKYRSNKLSADYSVVSQRKRYGSNLYSFETYTHIEPIKIINPTQQRMIYVTLDGARYRYIGNGGTLIGEGIAGAKNTLVEIDPSTSDGIRWRLTNANGDVFNFSIDGSLRRTEFTHGGTLYYEYDGARLLSKSDHFGRILSYSYDSHDRLISVTLPDSQSINYEYGQDEKALDFSLLKKVTWPTNESIGYLYNESGNISGVNTNKMLTGKLNSLGARVGTYKYDFNAATSTEGPLGSFKRIFTYSGNFTSVKDGLNSTRNYFFNTVLSDGTKLVTGTSQPAGSGCAAATKSATYYTDGLKKTETNFNGHMAQYAHDASRALETVRVEGIPTGNNTNYLTANSILVTGARKITTQWHSQHRKPIKKSEPKLITTFIYNGDIDPFNNNQIANCAATSLPLLCHKVRQATTDANGASGFNASLDGAIAARHEFYTYNDRGQQLTFSRTAAGAPDETREYYETTATDWTKGDLKKVTNKLNQATQFTRYDRNGRLLKMLDANNVETEFTYDARGRVLSQNIAGEITTHTYDLNGNRIGSVLPNGVSMTYHYDLAKRLVAVENSIGEKINYEYDVENNLRFERITNSSNAITYIKENVYDALSRLQNTLNSNNQGSTYLYDAKGNFTGEIDANTRSTGHLIDPLDRLTQTTNDINGKTFFNYDNQGNLTQVKDARNNATNYTYNAFGDLSSQTSPDTGITTFTYDDIGNRISSTDARQVTVNYGYDDLNRLASIQYSVAPTENVTYGYDATTNGNYGVGRLTSIVADTTRLDFEYNPQGLITRKYAQAANTFLSTQYRYDTAGKLTGITYPSGREVEYAMDALGRISSISTKAGSAAATQTLISNIQYLPFGPASSYVYGSGLTHLVNYNQDYRLMSIQVGSLLDRTYGYDPVSNITSITNNLHSNKSQNFGYDKLNRLETASGVYGDLIYSYDAVGNRLSEKRNNITDNYQYESGSNKLIGITRATGNRGFAYDAAGNPNTRTADDNSAQAFTFNKANRLSSVSVNATQAASYTYNPLGQRVVKSLPNGTKEIYHYDESGQLLAVADGTGNTLREYIYWDNQQIAFINNGSIYYIHNDHLNTPQVITNQNQQVVWMGDYEPFGKVAANASNSIEVFSRFPGQYLDSETGLYYNYFRDYDPSVGRYIESDPIGLEGGINTYAYVLNNPLIFSDPLGLKCKPIFDRSGNMIGQQCDGTTPGYPYPPNYSPTGDNSAFPAANNDASLFQCIKACMPTEESGVPSYIGYTCIGLGGAAIGLTRIDKAGPVVERTCNILAPYIDCKKRCEEEKKCPSN